jgi:hypothetical protein
LGCSQRFLNKNLFVHFNTAGGIIVFKHGVEV